MSSPSSASDDENRWNMVYVRYMRNKMPNSGRRPDTDRKTVSWQHDLDRIVQEDSSSEESATVINLNDFNRLNLVN